MLLPNGTHHQCIRTVTARRGLHSRTRRSTFGQLTNRRNVTRGKIITYKVNCGCIVRACPSKYPCPLLGVSRCPLPIRALAHLTSSYGRVLMMRSKRPFIRRRLGNVLPSGCIIGNHLDNRLPHAKRLAPSGIHRTLKLSYRRICTTTRGMIPHPPTLYGNYKRHSMCSTLGGMTTRCPSTGVFNSVNYCALNTLPPFHALDDYISVKTSVAVTGKTTSTNLFPSVTIVNSSAFARSKVANLLSTIGSGSGVAIIVSSGLAATVANNRSSTKAGGFRTVYLNLKMRPRRMQMIIPLPGGVRRVAHIVHRRVRCGNMSIVVPHERYVRALGQGLGRRGTRGR